MAEAVALANRARYHTPKVKIALSMGCYGASLGNGAEYTGAYGSATEEMLVQYHRQRFEAVKSSVYDVVLFETIPSLVELRAITRLLRTSLPVDRPVWISSCAPNGILPDGSDYFRDALPFLLESRCDAIGFNCIAPDQSVHLTHQLRPLINDEKVICYPNSGEVWDANTKSWVSKECTFIQNATEMGKDGVDIVGGKLVDSTYLQ
jgi:homocysteine S-methyltransferase